MATTTFQQEAHLLRKVSGSTALEKVLRKAVKILAQHGIPHSVGGGYAVQERGYPRFTKDVDIIVPNVAEARQKLLMSGFEKSPNSPIAVIDPGSKVEIDLLPGGGKPTGHELLPLPMPTQVSDQPMILPLDSLITTKLSVGRAQDFADVVQLIKANSLPREYAVDAAVRTDYEEAWDTAAAEQAAEGLVGEE
jgi:hypothetical protein